MLRFGVSEVLLMERVLNMIFRRSELAKEQEQKEKEEKERKKDKDS